MYNRLELRDVDGEARKMATDRRKEVSGAVERRGRNCVDEFEYYLKEKEDALSKEAMPEQL